MTAIIDIDIFADIICPWCYIGKKRLEASFCHAAKSRRAIAGAPFAETDHAATRNG